MAGAALVLQGVGRRFSGPPPATALVALDLDIGPGEFVAIVGPSGSGKTTALNMMGLLDVPTRGRCFVAGREVGGLSERERTRLRAELVGFVFQRFHLMDYRTAVDNVLVGLLYSRVARKHRLAMAHAALDRVGLHHLAETPVRHLSGGEQQRVAIARALAAQPSLLLCDEPTGNLDSVSARSVIDLLVDLNTDGVTVVMVTHDAAAAGRAQRTIELEDGTRRR